MSSSPPIFNKITTLQLTITSLAPHCAVIAEGSIRGDGSRVILDMDINGTRQGDTRLGIAICDLAEAPFTIYYLANLPQGEHTCSLLWSGNEACQVELERFYIGELP